MRLRMPFRFACFNSLGPVSSKSGLPVGPKALSRVAIQIRRTQLGSDYE